MDSEEQSRVSTMPFTITITEEADRHFRSLPARDQRFLRMAVSARLLHEPTKTTNAIKRLRPNPLAEFEMRAGNLRVLYNVEGNEVVILVVGRKAGNRLIVEGEEFHAHQDYPLEPPGNGPEKNA
jgi:mRNA-degrading endonuclease RelE of RelBE toxin-antitoxin system